MPTTLGKNLHLCFSRIKRPEFPMSQPDDHSRPLPTATAALIKNFNSIYDLTATTSKSHSGSVDDDDRSSDSDCDSDFEATATPDFATVYASQRFFFSSPGRSNSIIDSSSASSSTSQSSDTPPESESPITGGIAIPTYSPDPYMDFRRSMQEMVEARDLIDVTANWDYLHQLLLCYLSLNPKTTHKYIVGAFADLLVTLMSPQGCAVTDPDPDPDPDPSSGGGGCDNIPRRFM
ncbi:hypothetical protein PVL29_008424 [Vitis rotundifolia]|uniref:Transcription repressor n=1 Tax=Vitis rotundifolia TaxID=103349 RepID=A0AA38ZVQ1_VITRO|nr:hypothetical protein PVL29_008424 [Vitis rotundifolia]